MRKTKKIKDMSIVLDKRNNGQYYVGAFIYNIMDIGIFTVFPMLAENIYNSINEKATETQIRNMGLKYIQNKDLFINA